MDADVTEFSDIALRLSEEDVWKTLGYRGRTQPALADDVARGLALAQKFCKPRGLCARLKVGEVGRNSVTLLGGPPLDGRFLAHCFQGAQEAIFLVATIGPALEKLVSTLFGSGKTVEAFVLDAVGSAVVFNTFSDVAARVCQDAADRGWHTGMFLQPGQSYWDISGQRVIFQVVPGERIGVCLTDTCFMVPRKSQSGVLPVGPDLKVHSGFQQSYCRYCKAQRCPLRTEPPA